MGNLSFGDWRYYGSESGDCYLKGIFYPPPKFQSTPAPRRSQLASQSKDETVYVYIIKMGPQNIFKIGKSNDPQGKVGESSNREPVQAESLPCFQSR